MTRFARKHNAQGTQQREPEEATPWSQMVALVKPSGRGIEDEDDEDEYMEVEEEEVVAREGQIRPSLPNNTVQADSDSDDADEDHVMAGAAGQDVEEESEEEDEDYESRLDQPVSEDNPLKRRPELISSEEPAKKKKKKRPEKCKICGSKEHRKMNCSNLSEERRKELQDLYNLKVGRAGQGTGRKKKKKAKPDPNKLPYENDDVPAVEETAAAGEPAEGGEDRETTEDQENVDKSAQKSTKKKKKVNNRNRFKPNKEILRDRSGAVVEEGEAVFRGFRVRQEDWKRLKKLEKDLKSQGVKSKELDEALKKERRIAEKALARSKKLVCFKCRQPGHMLADCPLAGKDDQARPSSGICFKCGSLEHTSKECKSKRTREDAYNFASCFICKQEGHIAKSCPDNPRGLYPKGGGCVFCGSVEHLKRDCPRKVEKDLRAGVVVGTISDNLEDEPAHNLPFINKKKNKIQARAPKVVAF